MPEYLSPGVFIEEVSFRSKTIEGVTTSTPAFVGVATSGPTDEAQLVESFADFEKHYGKSGLDSYLAHAVRLFFANEGKRAYIARVAATINTTPSERQVMAAIQLLDDIDGFSLLAIPDITTLSVIDFAINYCERRGDCFYIADLPRSVNTTTQAQQAMQSLTDKSSFAAAYYPWLQIHDPVSRTQIAIPPSGAIAGVYARMDEARGVWKTPAGTDASLRAVTGLVDSISQQEQGLLSPTGLNVLRDNVASDPVVWGASTLARRDLEYRYVPVRRTAIFIEQSILKGTQWAVFEPNNDTLWSQLRDSVSDFLNALFRQGAFAGSKPDAAYFVKCDRQTTTRSDINNGIVNIELGFAPLRPAEFVVLSIKQKAGQKKS